MSKASIVLGLIIDATFLSGLGLYAVGLWRSFPEYAPLIMGLSLMALGVAAQMSRRSSNAD